MCEGKKITESLRQEKISKIIQSSHEDGCDWGNTDQEINMNSLQVHLLVLLTQQALAAEQDDK